MYHAIPEKLRKISSMITRSHYLISLLDRTILTLLKNEWNAIMILKKKCKYQAIFMDSDPVEGIYNLYIH